MNYLSRLLLFLTPVSVLVVVLQVPANTQLVATTEVVLPALPADSVTEVGDFRPGQLRLVGFDSEVVESSSQEQQASVAAPIEQTPAVIENSLRPSDLSPKAQAPTPASPTHVDPRVTISRLRELSQRYWSEPDRRGEFEAELLALAASVYLRTGEHFVEPYKVRPGDLLVEIADKYNVTWEYLADLNQVSPMRLRIGDSLKVSPGPFGVIVERSRHRLTMHSHGYVVATFEVGLGRPDESGQTSTPTGVFTVKERVKNPTWYGSDGVVDRDDPANPLGEYWIGLVDADGRKTGLGIHGTLAPDSIGQNQSRGCIRLRENDIRRLFRLLTVGAEVEIRD